MGSNRSSFTAIFLVVLFTFVVAWAINAFAGIEWPYCLWMAVLIDVALWALSKIRSHG